MFIAVVGEVEGVIEKRVSLAADPVLFQVPLCLWTGPLPILSVSDAGAAGAAEHRDHHLNQRNDHFDGAHAQAGKFYA